MCIAVVFVYLICQVPYIAAIGILTFYPPSARKVIYFHRAVSIAILLIAGESVHQAVHLFRTRAGYPFRGALGN